MRVAIAVATFATAGACCSCSGPPALTRPAPASAVPVVRVTGSDTMVNLMQAWAERYRAVRPDVVVEVAGGGSGVGIASIVAGLRRRGRLEPRDES